MLASLCRHKVQLRPCMQDSLARYPHEVIELTANNVTGPALEWAEANNIDILILGASPVLHLS